MNKKAVAWGVIIGGIAAIVIIATLLTPLKGVWHIVGERIFGMISPPSAEQFVPGVPVGDIVDYSARAFICAANTVAHGQIDFKTDCSDSDTTNLTSCPGVHYGPVCVDCSLVQLINKKAPKCKVIGFELTQDIQPSMVRDWIQGIGDPAYLFYYESFPDGEDKYWSANMLSTDVVAIAVSGIVSAALGPAGGLGGSTKKAITEGMGKDAMKTALKEPFKLMLAPFKAMAWPFKKMARLYSGFGAKKAAKIKLIDSYLKGELGKLWSVSERYAYKADDLTAILSKHVERDGSIKASQAQIKDELVQYFGKNYDELGFTATAKGMRGADITAISKSADELAQNIMKVATPIGKSELKFVELVGRKETFKTLIGSMDDAAVAQMSKQIDSLGTLPLKSQEAMFKEFNTIFDDMLVKKELQALDATVSQSSKLSLAALTAYSEKVWLMGTKVPYAGKLLSAAGYTGKGAVFGAKLTRDHKLLVMLGTGLFAQMIDRINARSLNGGKDSMWLSFGPAWPAPYPLKYNNTPLLRLLRGRDYSPPGLRFYLASPCKADLLVQGDDPAVCYVQAEDLGSVELYNFPEGTMPVKANSITFLNISEEMEKLQNELAVEVNSLVWQKPSKGKTGLLYKRIGNVLYARDGDNNLFKIDSYTGRFFAVPWDQEQGYAIQAAVMAQGANKWIPGNLVGGKYDWEYAVAGNYLFAKKGSSYTVLTNSGFASLNDVLVKDAGWTPDKIEAKVVSEQPQTITAGNNFADYLTVKARYYALYNLNGLFFIDFHRGETAYGIKNYAFAGSTDPLIKADWLAVADKSAESAEKQYEKIELDVASCISRGGATCGRAGSGLKELYKYVVDEDRPLYYSEKLLEALKKYQTEDWEIAKTRYTPAKKKYAEVLSLRASCFSTLEGGRDLTSCKDFENAFNELITDLELNEYHNATIPDSSRPDEKFYHDKYSVGGFLRDRAVQFHQTIVNDAPDLIKYHHLAADELVNLATEVLAARMYADELKEKQGFRAEFVAEIHNANMLKDQCVAVPFNSPVTAYAPCKEALDIYSKYAYADRQLLQMSLLFDYDDEVDYLLRDAEEGIIQIFDVEVTDASPGGWAKELFRRLQRYNIGDPGTGCINRGGIERRVPEWSDAYMQRFGLPRCRVDSYEALLKAWNAGALQIHYNPFDRALLDSLYFAGTTIDGKAVPYLDVREQMIIDPASVEKLKKFYAAIKVYNYLDFSGADYSLTKDIVSDQYRREVLGLEREWAPSEIVMFLDQRNMDCMKADLEISGIAPLNYYYTNIMKKSPADLCNNGYDGLYPAFLEAQLVPEFYSLRPGMTDFINFDHNQIPEVRRLASDKNMNDEQYPDLLARKKYIERLSMAWGRAEKDAFASDHRQWIKQNIVDLGRTHEQITQSELDDWVEASKRVLTNYNEYIDEEYATKECEKPKGTSLTPVQFKPNVITVTVDRGNYLNYSNGYNYCHSGKLGLGSKIAKGAIYFSTLFLDPVVYVTAEVMTKGMCRGFCGRIVLLGKGAGEAWLLQKIEKQVAWPNPP